MLRIKLVKSFIGQKPTNKETLRSMGLRRLGASVDLPNNDCTKGMIHKVKHMVTVEEVNEAKK
jgi:large subunit ribosomal protein L30